MMYEKIKDMLCEELEEITRKGELTAGTLDAVDKLTHAIKSVETIMAMNEYDDRSYADGVSTRRRGRSYDDGMSTARGRGRNARRDSMGRYSSDYSYDNAKNDMIKKLHELAEEAPDETTKRKLKKFMEEMQEV